MNISIVGPGRAGGALALAAVGAGHRITSIEGRSADSVDKLALIVPVEAGISDLRIVAVPDAAIGEVALRLAEGGEAIPTIHISGAASISLLAPIVELGVQVGSLHPLQSLPDVARGAGRFEGAWMAVTADEPLRSTLHAFAASLACHPFNLNDDIKPLYHAGAVAAANFTLTTLELSRALLAAAGVPFNAAQPLVETVIANAFDLGPAEALTGPVARGDTQTVARHIEAVRAHVPELEPLFVHLSRSTARLAGTSSTFEEVLP